MRKIARMIENIIAKGFVGLNFVLFILSLASFDSDNVMTVSAICIVSFAILVMFAIANGAMRGDWDER